MMICAVGPCNVKGIVCLTQQGFFKDKKGADFDSEFSALANCWKDTFSSKDDPFFFYSLPGKERVPSVSAPTGIKGKSHAISLQSWLTGAEGQEVELEKLIEEIVNRGYRQ